MHYLFEASVLDVELLGINKVKKFTVLLSGRQREEEEVIYLGEENNCTQLSKTSNLTSFTVVMLNKPQFSI